MVINVLSENISRMFYFKFVIANQVTLTLPKVPATFVSTRKLFAMSFARRIKRLMEIECILSSQNWEIEHQLFERHDEGLPP